MVNNRNKHRAIFEEAVTGYKAHAIEQLEKHIAAIRAGAVQRVLVSIPVPEDHTADYNRVIKMLDITLDEEIMLEEHDVEQYVQDNWAWKHQFLTSNAAYSAIAVQALSEQP